MKHIFDAIDKAIDFIETSKPYVPKEIFSKEAVPLLRQLRGIAFERSLLELKKKKHNADGDTVPQDLLD